VDLFLQEGGAFPSMLYEGSEKCYLFDFWIYDCMAIQKTTLHWEISIHCVNIYTAFEWKWTRILIIQMPEFLFLVIERLFLWVTLRWCQSHCISQERFYVMNSDFYIKQCSWAWIMSCWDDSFFF
jgi:hypothetical protein